MPEGEAIEHKWVNRSIEGAQKKVEAKNFDIRKQLLEYDDVPNQQRKVIYEQRNDILDNKNLKDTVDGIIGDVLELTVYEYIPLESIEEMWDIPALEKRLQADYAIKISITSLLKKEPNIAVENIALKIKDAGLLQYRAKEKLAGQEALHHFERSIMLQIFDHHWRAHLSSLDNLRQGIGLRAYGQKDPKQEFKKEAFVLFEQLLETIKFEITRVLMLVTVKDESDATSIDKKNTEAVKASANKQNDRKDLPPSTKKVGRNEPCPCGNGKKYKHCCGALN